jgi:integrase
MKLTKTIASQIKVPAGKAEHFEWDDDIPGFAIRARRGGSRVYLLQYRLGRKQRKITYGSVSAVSAQDARARAAQDYARVKLGEDPAGRKIENRARAHETLDHVLPIYLPHKNATLRPRTYIGVERHLKVHCKPLHGLQLTAISQRNVATLLAGLATSSGPTAANHVRTSLSGFFTWAMGEGLVGANPVSDTNLATVNGSRERVLADEELAAIWSALPDNGYGAVTKLLALTGCRREEIGGLRWSEVDLERAQITLPSERAKNKKEHEIPLSPPALAILRDRKASADSREHVFGRGTDGFRAWSHSKRLLDQQLAANGKTLPGWTLHDLRRTMSTRMHEVGIAPHIVEAVLNHTSGHKAGVAGVYNHARYAREKATALVRWADYVLAVVEGRPATETVVQLRA